MEHSTQKQKKTEKPVHSGQKTAPERSVTPIALLTEASLESLTQEMRLLSVAGHSLQLYDTLSDTCTTESISRFSDHDELDSRMTWFWRREHPTLAWVETLGEDSPEIPWYDEAVTLFYSEWGIQFPTNQQELTDKKRALFWDRVRVSPCCVPFEKVVQLPHADYTVPRCSQRLKRTNYAWINAFSRRAGLRVRFLPHYHSPKRRKISIKRKRPAARARPFVTRALPKRPFETRCPDTVVEPQSASLESIPSTPVAPKPSRSYVRKSAPKSTPSTPTYTYTDDEAGIRLAFHDLKKNLDRGQLIYILTACKTCFGLANHTLLMDRFRLNIPLDKLLSFVRYRCGGRSPRDWESKIADMPLLVSEFWLAVCPDSGRIDFEFGMDRIHASRNFVSRFRSRDVGLSTIARFREKLCPVEIPEVEPQNGFDSDFKNIEYRGWEDDLNAALGSVEEEVADLARDEGGWLSRFLDRIKRGLVDMFRECFRFLDNNPWIRLVICVIVVAKIVRFLGHIPWIITAILLYFEKTRMFVVLGLWEILSAFLKCQDEEHRKGPVEKQGVNTWVAIAASSIILKKSSFANRLLNHTKFQAGLDSYLDGCKDGLRGLVNLVLSCFSDKRVDWFLRENAAIDSWIKQTEAFTLHMAIDKVIDAEATREFQRLIMDGENLKNMHSKDAAWTKKINVGLDKLQRAAIQFPAFLSPGKSRAEPIGIMFYGRSGCGKSTLTKRLTRTLAAAVTSTPLDESRLDQLVYQKGTSQYWDGYANHPVTAMDDFCQGIPVAGQEDSEPEIVVKAINQWPFPLNMAALPLKGRFYFDSSFVVATTNVKNREHFERVMTCVDALARRFPYWLEMERRSNPDGSANKFPFDPDYDPDFEWTFYEYDICEGRRVPGGKQWKYSELLDAIMKDHIYRMTFDRERSQSDKKAIAKDLERLQKIKKDLRWTSSALREPTSPPSPAWEVTVNPLVLSSISEEPEIQVNGQGKGWPIFGAVAVGCVAAKWMAGKISHKVASCAVRGFSDGTREEIKQIARAVKKKCIRTYSRCWRLGRYALVGEETFSLCV
jgi:energy-coupling factor transporter ATP-binding protein EcfA2